MAGESRDQTQDRTPQPLNIQACEINETGRPPEQFIDFADGIRSILKRAIVYMDKDPPSMEERENACREFQEEMKTFLDRKRTDEDAVRISNEL